MKPLSEVLDYLDAYYARMIQRPSMYSASPAAMEDKISFIEDLRAFLLDDPEQAERFKDFTVVLGYEARGCSSDGNPHGFQSAEESALFARVAMVLECFLSREGRLKHLDDKGDLMN
jgi:hypothetical protein